MRDKKINFRLYIITDRKLFTHYSFLFTAVQEALKGGVKAIQLREKDLTTRELLRLAYRMRKLTDKYGAMLFINDRLDIALAVGADGVHLTQNSISVNAVKNVVKNRLFIGVSTHSLKEAKDAQDGGADFITFGPIFRTPSKLKYGEPVGTEALKEVVLRLRIPVFAIGGVKVRKISEVKEAGAFGIAMISGIMSANNIKQRTKEIIASLTG
jgi:thiamine-phosphate pyrophosphorylase